MVQIPYRGDDRNRTGVDGFAGRCVATPPRRRKHHKRIDLAARIIIMATLQVCLGVTQSTFPGCLRARVSANLVQRKARVY